MARRKSALILLTLLALTLLSIAATQARERPELALSGGAPAAIAIQLLAGLALAAGAIACVRRGEAALAAALIGACVGVGLRSLPAPPHGALLFTLALIGAGVAPAAAAHAALLYPDGHLGKADRIAAASGYLVHVGLGGLLLVFVFDAGQAGCFGCPSNLLLIHGEPQLASWLETTTPRVMALTECALGALVAVRVVRHPAAARSLAAPVSAAAIVVLAIAALANLRAADALALDATDRDLWVAACVALGLLAAGLAWRPLRAARLRGALGRLTVAASADIEDIRSELARALGDPGLAFVLPHPETGAAIALDGTPVATPAAGRERTPVERHGRVVAWLEHISDLRGVPELPATIARPAALALERAALRVARRLQEDEVRASTGRLIAAGDAERRRLERDLHDGAQQRLLGLGLALERARACAAPGDATTLEDACIRMTAMRTDLRRVAHGIHSVTLAEGGLAEAVLALVDAAAGRVSIQSLPLQRAPAAIEAAVHRLVATTLQAVGDASVRLSIVCDDDVLESTIQIEGASAEALRDALAGAVARVAAAGGTVTIDANATLRAAIPVRVHPVP